MPRRQVREDRWRIADELVAAVADWLWSFCKRLYGVAGIPGGCHHGRARSHRLLLRGSRLSVPDVQIPGRVSCDLQRLMAAMRVVAYVSMLAVLSLAANAAEPLSGVPIISDGDTLEIGTTTIPLASIDAPESDQVCLDASQQRWTCGIEARDRLSAHIAGRSIDCIPTGTDDFKRTLAKCTIGGEDLNRWIVQEGLALAFVRYSKEYVPDEQAARASLGFPPSTVSKRHEL
jgi:endonuclease YncB( thermonuclease family)